MMGKKKKMLVTNIFCISPHRHPEEAFYPIKILKLIFTTLEFVLFRCFQSLEECNLLFEKGRALSARYELYR